MQVRLHASTHLSLKKNVIYGHCLVVHFALHNHRNMEMVDIAIAHLNAEIILVVTVYRLDNYKLPLPLSPPTVDTTSVNPTLN